MTLTTSRETIGTRGYCPKPTGEWDWGSIPYLMEKESLWKRRTEKLGYGIWGDLLGVKSDRHKCADQLLHAG